MSPLTTLIIILGLAGLGYLLGRRRAVALVAGDTRQLHSRPAYHGWLVALLAALPPLGLLALGGLARPLIPARPTARGRCWPRRRHCWRWPGWGWGSPASRPASVPATRSSG